MLDAKKYGSSNDYLESVLAIKDLDPKTDKYRIRKEF